MSDEGEDLSDEELEREIDCGVIFEVPDDEINSIKAVW